MLTRLIIQDVVLIDRLSVPFQGGLNVLSGETGAGKSILLDALGLALGARSEAGLVRQGAKQASVTAEFSGALPQPLQALLDEQALVVEEPLILRRTVGQDGKSRAFLCDQPIGVTLLRQIGECLLEVHGQFETHGLLNPASHRALLDAYAGTLSLQKQTASAYQAWQASVDAHQQALAEHDRARAEEEYLKAAVAELDELGPEEGEIDRLALQRTQLQHREKIVEALQTVGTALSGERGACSALAVAGKNMAKIADKTEGLAPLLSTVDRLADETQEVSLQLSHFMNEIVADESTLEKIEERLFRLRGLARKHNILPDGLHGLQAELKARLDLLLNESGQLAKLAQEALKARKSYVEKAEKLSQKRTQAAEKLATSIMKELPPLKFERARFAVTCERLEEAQWSGEGMDRVAFLAATNPGQSPSPLHKVASGGELSRFMLAIKVVLAKADPVPTLVFDEVDAGIGGATASAVGERLAKLGKDVQVLVVTHSPQVAARASHHLHVEKKVKAGKASTFVAPLSDDERLEEIARMLSGAQTTDAARQAAAVLLKG